MSEYGLQKLSLSYVLDHWRPGSFDRTWAKEFADLGSPGRIGEMLRTWDEAGNPSDGTALRMLRGEPVEPITLGWDGGWWNGLKWRGRVWDGHRRLWLHHAVPLDDVRCDVVEPGGQRFGEAAHCGPEIST